MRTKKRKDISYLKGASVLLGLVGIIFLIILAYSRIRLDVSIPGIEEDDVPASYAVRDEATIVTIRNMKFSPPIIIIKKGERVIWMNRDNVNHKIKSDSEDLNFFSKELTPEEQSEFVINQSGVFDYSCELYPQMKGQIIVQE